MLKDLRKTGESSCTELPALKQIPSTTTSAQEPMVNNSNKTTFSQTTTNFKKTFSGRNILHSESPTKHHLKFSDKKDTQRRNEQIPRVNLALSGPISNISSKSNLKYKKMVSENHDTIYDNLSSSEKSSLNHLKPEPRSDTHRIKISLHTKQNSMPKSTLLTESPHKIPKRENSNRKAVSNTKLAGTLNFRIKKAHLKPIGSEDLKPVEEQNEEIKSATLKSKPQKFEKFAKPKMTPREELPKSQKWSLSETEKKVYGNRAPKQYEKVDVLGRGGCALVWLA